MPLSYVQYDLQDGYVHNWLVAGPQEISARAQAETPGHPASLARPETSKKSGIRKMPVERGPLTEGVFQIGEYQGSWSYFRCEADHYVDLSATYPLPTWLRAWAYTQLVSSSARPLELSLETWGPVDVWLNKKHVFRQEQSSASPLTAAFQVSLEEGQNEVLLRFEALAAPVGLLSFALRAKAADGLHARIPTLMPALERRNELEEVYQKIYLDRDIYGAGDEIYLCWPEGGEKSTYNDVHFKRPSGLIQGMAEDVGQPGDSLFLGYAQTADEGTSTALVMPRAWEYFESQTRITKELKAVLVVKSQFSDRPYGSLEERRIEALGYAAQHGAGVFSEIARMGLGQWQGLDQKRLGQVIDKVNQRRYGSELTVLGLAGTMARFGSRPEFPRAVKKLVKECLLGYRYTPEEPASGAPRDLENLDILLAAGKILAGQLYPDQLFTDCGLNGRWVCQEGEQQALDWMHKRGALGLAAWDSPSVYADAFTALAHLVDLARKEPVFELASVCLDKLLYSLALNSFRGSFGSTRGSTQTSEVKSSYLEPTSGVSRVLWGLGIFNEHISGTVSAALLKNYELPANIAEIAAFWPEEVWSKEQQACGAVPVNKVMYRTADTMLSSAQDYRAGESGSREHIWQATLGPTCAVFGSHPIRMTENEAHSPNFWRGNGVLPRVAQWKDVLIALYRLPADDRLGFTHVYFPTKSFDETAIRDGWAFGRQGDGYIALTASQPIELVRQGHTALRELRAYGHEVAWVCHMGRQALDGDFSAFQEKVLGLRVSFEGLDASLQTLRSDELSFGWQRPFLRNGVEQPLAGFKHFDSPYCVAELPCKSMEIRTMEYILRLDFDEAK